MAAQPRRLRGEDAADVEGRRDVPRQLGQQARKERFGEPPAAGRRGSQSE
jgi:hypothetical protein